MRSIITFALVFIMASAEVHADLITYNITGTVTSVGMGANPSSVTVGDHIAWTLSYDRSTSSSFSSSSAKVYVSSGPVLTNIVDQTTGTSLFSPTPPHSVSTLSLVNSSSAGYFTANDYGPHGYMSQFRLRSGSLLPMLNLAQLQLDTLPLAWGHHSPFLGTLAYNNWILRTGTSFNAGVTSVSISGSGSISSVTTPEPASLTLFALGAVGIAVRRFRPRLWRVGQRA